MGINLSLLPIECDMDGLVCSWSIIDCQRQGDLFDAIRPLPKQPAPADLMSYRPDDSESSYGMTTTDPYGSPLECVTAGALRKAKRKIELYPRNAAAWAYLAALDPKTKIVLYWH